jgi:ABC-type phosphate/phosphonate transport system substrate-binding protein
MMARAQTNTGPLVFSAPPRESAEEGAAIYKPIADYLSAALGKPVVYKHSGNWLIYQTEMQRGNFDIVFDGPHFNGWRVDRMHHNTLVKIPGDHVFVVVVRKDNASINELRQLSGRRVCGMSSPNLGTLTMLNQFDNPSRQPVLVDTEGWDNVYKGVISGQCVGAVIPLNNLHKYDIGSTFTRIIYRGSAMPNQAFSAGPRLTPEEQSKISQALLSKEAMPVTERLRAAYAADGALVPARREEYVALGSILKDVWGYQ